MSDYPGLMAGTGLLPQHLANSIAQVASVFGGPASGVTEHGTGFLVRRKDGKSYLVTAAHVLFKPPFGYPRRVTLLFGQWSDSYAMAVTVEAGPGEPFVVADEFRQMPVPSAGSDFGLVRITDPQGDLANYHHFIASSADPVQSIVRLYGYPKNDNDPQSDDPFYTVLEAVPEGSQSFSYAHIADQQGPTAPATYRGMSGGPLIGNSSTDQTDRVFGIHTRGGTDVRAVRMSSKVRNTLKGWIGTA